MSSIRRLIREIHRRSLWQVLSIYLGASWFVLQVADHLVNKFGLPPWVYGLALLLLLLGLPIVLATAFVQEGGPGPDEPVAPAARTGPGAPEEGRAVRRLFTWRHAILGGLVAFAAWGLVAAGWLLLLRRDPEALPWPRPDTAPLRVAARSSPAGTAEADGPGREEAPSPAGSASLPGSTRAARDDTGARTGTAGEPLRTATADGTVRGPAARSDAPPERRRPSSADREAYDSVNAAEEAARSAAAALSADTLAPDVFLAADSLRAAGLEAAASGRYREAALGLERALATYQDARRHAERAWRSALEREGTRVAEARAAADTGLDAYRQAAEAERQSAELSAGGRLSEALEASTAAAELYRAARAPVRSAATENGGAAAGRAGEAAGPASTETAARATVTGLLEELSAAIAAEDLAAVERVWTSLTPEQSANMERFFRDRRDIRVTFDVDWPTMAVVGDRIDFEVRTVWEYFDESRGERVKEPSFRQRFRATRSAGAWTLASS